MEQEKKIIDLSDRFFKIIVVFVAGVIILGFGSLVYQFRSLPHNYPQQISINGEGKVFIKPDIATVSFGVETQGTDSQNVVERSNQTMNGIIAAVKESEIEDKDIQTSSYSLTPLYHFTERGRVFNGYILNQSINVKIRDFNKISEVLAKATSAGATNVGELRFTVDNIEKHRNEAREKAIDQAKEKAKVIFGQAGLRMGRIANIHEDFGGFPPLPYGEGFGGATRDLAMPIVPQIEAGEMEVVSNVTLVYWVR